MGGIPREDEGETFPRFLQFSLFSSFQTILSSSSPLLTLGLLPLLSRTKYIQLSYYYINKLFSIVSCLNVKQLKGKRYGKSNMNLILRTYHSNVPHLLK